MVLSAAVAAVTVGIVGYWRAEAADREQVNRGKYLVTLGLCTDCHTLGYFFGKPDMARFLAGSEVGFEVPGLGVFHGRNLTPDVETGIGTWSAETGTRPDGRILASIMPWHALRNLRSRTPMRSRPI
jgi:mono/diheme cytochrome c family protein